MSISRRELFGFLRRPADPTPEPATFSLDAFYAARAPAATLPVFDVRTTEAHANGYVPTVIESACLATRSFCSVCVERCPRPGAIVVERGRPRVVPDACDGCGRCIAACPAPVLAFALVARTPGPNEAPDV